MKHTRLQFSWTHRVFHTVNQKETNILLIALPRSFSQIDDSFDWEWIMYCSFIILLWQQWHYHNIISSQTVIQTANGKLSTTSMPETNITSLCGKLHWCFSTYHVKHRFFVWVRVAGFVWSQQKLCRIHNHLLHVSNCIYQSSKHHVHERIHRQIENPSTYRTYLYVLFNSLCFNGHFSRWINVSQFYWS